MGFPSNSLALIGLPEDALDGSPPILADYLIADVGRDIGRADMLLAAVIERTATRLHGNLYCLELGAEGVSIHHLYDPAQHAHFPYSLVINWLRRWGALLQDNLFGT